MKKDYIYLMLIFANISLCIGLGLTMFGPKNSLMTEILQIVFFILSALLAVTFAVSIWRMKKTNQSMPGQPIRKYSGTPQELAGSNSFPTD